MKCLLLGAGKTSIECLKTLIRLKKQVSICLNRDELDKIKKEKQKIKTKRYL